MAYKGRLSVSSKPRADQGGFKVVNMAGASGSVSLDDAQFAAMYNEWVQFLSNQVGDSRLSYARLSRNQGWNNDCDGGWRD
ncbi:hypothetical protein MTR67_052743 [Solanum verrucosum]|uniref:Uncharacterized protein n=1 Tax=Solanum verrucosum TaxID=315347 RepID=A0AAF1A341_SOLVR|nr:hypothetical protein MTR67_052743 [Solanum verrucosum]